MLPGETAAATAMIDMPGRDARDVKPLVIWPAGRHDTAMDELSETELEAIEHRAVAATVPCSRGPARPEANHARSTRLP